MQKNANRTADSSAARGKPGRPPVYSEAEREKRIIGAAEAVFTTVGYGAATMEEIARAAGMSKKTLYGMYRDKQHLLAAVTVAADDFPWEDDQGIALDDPVAELRRRLILAIEFVLKPRQIYLTRLMISEAGHSPELSINFHDRVILRCQSYLASAVENLNRDTGVRGVENIMQTTGTLLGAAMGEFHIMALLGKSAPPDRQRIADQVDAVLKICGLAPAK